jgi:hypothetical protein
MKLKGRPIEDIEDNDFIQEIIRLMRVAEYNNMKPQSISISENVQNSIRNYIATKGNNYIATKGNDKYLLGMKIKKIIPDITIEFKESK